MKQWMRWNIGIASTMIILLQGFVVYELVGIKKNVEDNSKKIEALAMMAVADGKNSEQTALVSDYDFSYTDMEEDLADVAVDVVFSMAEKSTSVVLAYRGIEPTEIGHLEPQLPKTDGEWRTVPMTSEDGLIYHGNFEAMKYGIYEVKVQVDGSLLLRSETLGTAEPIRYFYPETEAYMDGIIQGSHSFPSGKISYEAAIVYDGSGHTPEQVHCELIYKDQVVDSFDLLELGEKSDKADGNVIYSLQRSYICTESEGRPDTSKISFRMTVDLASEDMVYQGEWQWQ